MKAELIASIILKVNKSDTLKFDDCSYYRIITNDGKHKFSFTEKNSLFRLQQIERELK